MKKQIPISNNAMLAKELYELIESLGDGIHKKVHVIETHDFNDGFRVYHADGYCFDVIKEAADEDEYMDVIDGYCYFLGEEIFDGFKTATLPKAIELIKEVKS